MDHHYQTKVVYNVKKNIYTESLRQKCKKSTTKDTMKSFYVKGVKTNSSNDLVIQNVHADIHLRKMEDKVPTKDNEFNQTEKPIKIEPTTKSSPGQKIKIEQKPSDKDKSFIIVSRGRKLPSFIILHYSPFKAVWDWIVLLLVLYTAVFTPYTTAFLLNEDKTKAQLNKDPKTRSNPESENKAEPFVVIDLIVDVIFIADIFINFRTTYVHNGEVISDPQKIARNYIRKWFLLDACAAIPFDLVVFGTGGSTDIMTSTGVLKTARLLRLLRVARRFHQYYEYGALMMLFLMATFALVAHWLACIFYAIAHYERQTWNVRIGWLDALAKEYKEPYIDNRSDSLSLGGPKIESRYVTSLYFVFTAITSIGFGNVSPNTNLEKLFSIFAMLIGSMMSAFIFGNVSSIMLRLYQGSEESHEGRSRIKEFIKFHRIPKHLAKRLQDSFETNTDYSNGINMNTILRIFPECLQADICLHMNRTLLNTFPAFKGASAGCLRAFALKFRTTHIPPGDMFIHPGDLIESVYFISRGSIEIIYVNENSYQDRLIMGVLNVHDIFGGCPTDFMKDKLSQSRYGVRAVGFVDLHRIMLADLKEILLMYPEWSAMFLKSFKLTFKLDDFHPSILQKYKTAMSCESKSESKPVDIKLRQLYSTGSAQRSDSVFEGFQDSGNPRIDLDSVTKRMQHLNSRVQEMERNYQAAFTEILQLLTSS